MLRTCGHVQQDNGVEDVAEGLHKGLEHCVCHGRRQVAHIQLAIVRQVISRPAAATAAAATAKTTAATAEIGLVATPLPLRGAATQLGHE